MLDFLHVSDPDTTYLFRRSQTMSRPTRSHSVLGGAGAGFSLSCPPSSSPESSPVPSPAMTPKAVGGDVGEFVIDFACTLFF